MPPQPNAVIAPLPGYFWAKFQDGLTIVQIVPLRGRSGASVLSYIGLVPGDSAPLSLDMFQLLEGPLVPPQARQSISPPG